MRSRFTKIASFLLSTLSIEAGPTNSIIHKIEDVVIYRDEKFYSAFPSIVCRPDGELLVAFRRAPERRKLGDPCMLQLRDHSILCSSYGWAELRGEAAAKMTNAYRHGNFVFLGGYILRSKTG